MKSLKGTKTGENLVKAYIGESQARNRYSFFSEVADDEGYPQICKVFKEIADQELEHADEFYNMLVKGYWDELPTELTIAIVCPVALGTTLDNLKHAIAGETKEWGELYPAFAKVAESEGFSKIASLFENVAICEKHHEMRYQKLLDLLDDEAMYERSEPVLWTCEVCGYCEEDDEAPEKCPVCGSKQEDFVLCSEVY